MYKEEKKEKKRESLAKSWRGMFRYRGEFGTAQAVA